MILYYNMYYKKLSYNTVLFIYNMLAVIVMVILFPYLM